MHCDGLCPQQVVEPSQIYDCSSPVSLVCGSSVPNKSTLLFLLFLLSLSRLPLRPFLSDNEPGMLSSCACVGHRPGWRQDCTVQTRGFLSHCADFPLARPSQPFLVCKMDEEDLGTRQGSEGGKSRCKGFILSGLSGQPMKHTPSLCQLGFQYHFHSRHQRKGSRNH